MSDYVLSETHGKVLVLTMNDPSTRNSLGPDIMGEMIQEIDRFTKSPDLGALVITGADPAFSSGANVRGFQRNIDEQPQQAEKEPGPWERFDPAWYDKATVPATGPEIVRALYNLQKPSVAAVNGPAYGLGCGIALSCDIRIASDRASFSEAFVRNGLVSADGSCWQLPRLIGMGNALLMQYTGDAIEGDEAYRMGLVSKLVPHEKLMESTLELATRLANGPTVAYALTKMLVLKSFGQSFSEALADGVRAQALTRKTEDHREGVRAFLEKRQPVFKGR